MIIMMMITKIDNELLLKTKEKKRKDIYFLEYTHTLLLKDEVKII
jgi:hypothetical protein